MFDVLITFFSLAVPLSGYFFWGRGIIRSNQSDMVLGVLILALSVLIYVVISNTSAVFSDIGILGIAFGIETLVASFFAGPKCPIKKWQLVTLGTAALIAGVLLGLIV